MTEQRFVDSGDGVRIAVHEEGAQQGPVLVLVHGHPGTHRVWDGLAGMLADRFRIVRYDLRGAGDSAAPKALSSYHVQRYADDFAAVIDATSPDRPVHVLAHGWGSAGVGRYLSRPGADGRVASLTAVSDPDPGHLAHGLRATLSRPQQPVQFADGLARLARLAAAGPRILANKPYRANLISALNAVGAPQPVAVPVQLVATPGDPFGGRPSGGTAWAPRLWRRDITTDASPESNPRVLARVLTQFVDHVDGGEAPRELLRAQVGRNRKPFGDMLVAVTGAASGIGRATALAFAREGADIVVSDVDTDGLAETARLVADIGTQAYPYPVDVSDPAAVEAFADQVSTVHGVPDVLVNNAGVGHMGFFLDTPADEFDRVIDINFGGVVNGCRSFGRRLRDRGLGGHIVNVSSMAAYAPLNVMSPYCTSKAAVFMFSDCLRAELDSSGIGVTTICPGVVGTNIVDTTRFSLPDGRAEDAEALRGRARKGFTMRHYGPEKVADAIVDAVKTNKAVRPVTPEAHVVYAAAHALPQVMRSTARGGNVV